MNFLSHSFLVALEDLRLSAGPGEELVAFLVDPTNTFWSLRLHEHLWGIIRVLIDGLSYGFSCLSFGWQFSPITRQTLFGFIRASLGFFDVIVLQDLDVFLLAGSVRPKV